MKIILIGILFSMLISAFAIAQSFAPIGPGNSGVPLGPSGGGGGGGAPIVPCNNANGLDYTKTCDAIYHMGVFQ